MIGGNTREVLAKEKVISVAHYCYLKIQTLYSGKLPVSL